MHLEVPRSRVEPGHRARAEGFVPRAVTARVGGGVLLGVGRDCEPGLASLLLCPGLVVSPRPCWGPCWCSRASA